MKKIRKINSSFSISNELNFAIKFNIHKQFQKILKQTIKLTKIKPKTFFVNLVDENEIKAINSKYRNKNDITDVISFCFDDNNDFNPIQGEIYICYQVACNQAIKYQHSLERELCFLFLHGLLHLLGYNHIKPDEEKIMFKLQDDILNKAKIYR